MQCSVSPVLTTIMDVISLAIIKVRKDFALPAPYGVLVARASQTARE